MGSLLAVYYWNTGRDVLPTRQRNQNTVETSVPSQQLNELVITELVEVEPRVDTYYRYS